MIGIWVEADLKEDAQRAAQARQETLTDFVGAALAEALRKRQREGTPNEPHQPQGNGQTEGEDRGEDFAGALHGN